MQLMYIFIQRSASEIYNCMSNINENWNEFYAGQAMKIQWGKMKFSNDCRFHYRLRLIDIQVHLFCIFWISTRISIFAIHCNGIVNGNCDRDLCLCLYYLYDEDNRPHSWFRRRMVGSFVGFRYIGIWAHRFSTGHIFSSFQCRIFVSLLTEKTCSYVKRAWIVC